MKAKERQGKATQGEARQREGNARRGKAKVYARATSGSKAKTERRAKEKEGKKWWPRRRPVFFQLATHRRSISRQDFLGQKEKV